MAHHSHEPTPAHIQKFLRGVNYPASKDNLIDAARQNGAPEDVVHQIEQLPGERFEGAPGVMKAFGRVR